MSSNQQSPDLSIREALSDMLGTLDPTLAGRLEHDVDSHLDLVDLTHRTAQETTLLLQSAVESARLAGASWERIGQRLGMSRQAAQQRFGRANDRPADDAPSDTTRRLTPVTALDEMEALAAAGHEGWHSVGYGMYFHDLVQSDQQWEHLRVAAFGPRRRDLEQDGWQRIGSMWFPWAYYARPTGVPVVSDEEPDRT